MKEQYLDVGDGFRIVNVVVLVDDGRSIDNLNTDRHSFAIRIDLFKLIILLYQKQTII